MPLDPVALAGQVAALVGAHFPEHTHAVLLKTVCGIQPGSKQRPLPAPAWESRVPFLVERRRQPGGEDTS